MPIIIPGNRLASTGYTIDQSIRFNDDDSPVLTASQTGAGDTRKKNTFSVWVKRGNLTSLMYIGAYRYDATNYQYYSFDSSDRVEFTDVSGGSVIGKLVTNRVFRDPSAWYNLTFVWDTANATPAQRMIIYVNGERVTSFSTETYPSINTDSGGAGRASSTMRIGTYDATGNYLDGYLTNIVYVDNSALDSSSFGETNDNGIWIPKDVSGLTFGTRGFYIDGRDSSALGDDESGSNDFGTSGLAAHDQVFDTPSNNFCVLNPISIPQYGGNFNRGVAQTNLAAYNAGGAETYAIGTMAFSSGKWYWEFYTTSYPAGNGIIYGITEQDYWEANGTTSHSYIGKRAGLSERHTTSAYSYWAYNTSSISASSLTPFQQGVVVGTAVDMSTNTITFTTNGSAYASKDFDDFSYAFGSNAQFPVWRLIAATTLNINFGQDSTFNGQVTAGGNADGNGHGNFKYSVPSGHLALCTKNLGS